MSTERLVGAGATLRMGDGLGVWLDAQLVCAATLPIKVKSGVEYIVLDYETKTEFIGVKTYQVVPLEHFEFWENLFVQDKLEIERILPQIDKRRIIYQKAVKEGNCYNVPISTVTPFRITKGKHNIVVYILRFKEDIEFPFVYRFKMVVEGYQLENW